MFDKNDLEKLWRLIKLKNMSNRGDREIEKEGEMDREDEWKQKSVGKG